MESTADFKGASVNDLVLLIITPIIEEFIVTTGRYKVRLLREKQIGSEDEQTGEYGSWNSNKLSWETIAASW